MSRAARTLMIVFCTFVPPGSGQSADADAKARFHWIMNCQGCHQADATGSAKGAPNMLGTVGQFLAVDGGREYLGRVPGVAFAPLSDQDLADLLNWSLATFDPQHLPPDFRPYTGEEVKALRADPLVTDAPTQRRALLARLPAPCVGVAEPIQTSTKEDAMSTYVLVHGAWHGAWCWYKVVAALEQAGHRVIVPDLAALGRDKTSVKDVSLETWTSSIVEILEQQTEPVILVGHSRGGIIISEAAEKKPEKVKCLIYLCAFLLKDGQSLLKVAEADGSSRVLPNLVVSDDQVSSMVKREAFREVYYNTSPAEEVTLASLLLMPEPLSPMLTPIHVSANNFGNVRRVYIECLQDNAIPPRLQKKMYSESPCEKVITMDTDHSPFFSAPQELSRHLESIR